MAEPSQKAIEYLLANPDTADFFDEKFGKGSALKILQPQQTQQPQAPLTAGQVVKGAVTSFVPSVGNMIGDLISAISSPIQTGKAILDVAAGTLQNILPERLVQAIGEDKASREAANMVGKMYLDRYGSVEGVKKVIATDPAAFLADVSTVLTGGSMAATKAPAISAKLSQAASVVDPLALTARTAVAGTKALGTGASNLLGMTTGAGTEAVKQAYRAGAEGGDVGKQFTASMRGQADPMDVLNAAKQNLEQLRIDRSNAYRTSIQTIKGDKTVLDFTGIDKALNDEFAKVSFKGKITNQEAANVLQQAKEIVDDWKKLDPAEFHTPEGIDALKQSVGQILEGLQPRTKSDMVVKGVYNSIKNEINKQAPTYAKTMKAYTDSTEQIREIERALSLGDKASADTAMRKLQSLMRNNANTNYGQRLSLAKQLEEQGGREIMPSLAGQALSEFTPRGIQRATAPLGGIGLFSVGGAPAAAVGAAMSSPRVVGESAYKTGQLGRGLLGVQSLIPELDYPTMFNLLYQAEQMKQ